MHEERVAAIMKIEITPTRLSGKLKIPSSKSVSHRALICAALANGTSKLNNVLECKDTEATIDALVQLGAKIQKEENTLIVTGIDKASEKADIYCKESGSTLRFIIPIAAALGTEATFYGEGKLPERPIIPYLRELTAKDIHFNYSGGMPFSISGQMYAGRFVMEGDISSQFISGLLFALPIIKGDSKIEIRKQLESKPYVDITIECLKKFGIKIEEKENVYFVKGSQKYKPMDMAIEGDYSQAAFYFVANELGSNVIFSGINPYSTQGDKVIVDIIKECNKKYRTSYGNFDVDAANIPDLVPILTVLASFADGTSVIRNCGRLRLKESDRLEAISNALNKIGGKVEILQDNLVINGVKSLSGGEIDSCNDHRIAMAMAVASQKCTENLIINGADCVEKSYPNFFKDFTALGGKYNVLEH